MIRREVLLLIGIAVALGCNDGGYSGDGSFTDFGASRATERYELDLGDVSLQTDRVYHYSVTHLPPTEFVFGLELRAPFLGKFNGADRKLIHAHVDLRMTDEEGRTVIDESAPLAEWVWSHARDTEIVFAYRRPGEKTGTYFTPIRGETYTVSLVITEADETGRPYDAFLKATGGGWK